MTTEENQAEDGDMPVFVAYPRSIAIGASDPLLSLLNDLPVFEMDVQAFDDTWAEFEELSLTELWDQVSDTVEKLSGQRPISVNLPPGLTRCEMTCMIGEMRVMKAQMEFEGTINEQVVQ